jgi:integrase
VRERLRARFDLRRRHPGERFGKARLEVRDLAAQALSLGAVVLDGRAQGGRRHPRPGIGASEVASSRRLQQLGQDDGCDFVLVNPFGRPLGAPMRPKTVSDLFPRLSRRAGLERPVTLHMLRHAAGTALAEQGGGSAAPARPSRQIATSGR